MTREEGQKMVDKYDGKIPMKYMAQFLEEFDLTMDDFMKLCNEFRG